MKVGVIARADARGLAHQSWEFARAMEPERVLLVDLLPRRWPIHPEWYPGATLVGSRNGSLPEAKVREWLDGLDVVYMPETPYCWPALDWARQQDVATVIHVNPEFFRDRGHEPSTWWAPTSWRLNHLPTGTRQVPVPVPLDRWPETDEVLDGPIRWLHVGGMKALGDRNGVEILGAALRLVRERHHVTLRSQDRSTPSVRPGSNVKLTRASGSLMDYWSLYPGHDVLVMPRRYGGLSLPAIEAAGAGLGLVMTGCAPNQDWPIEPIQWSPGKTLTTAAGPLDTADASPSALAAIMDSWAQNPGLVQDARLRARAWAEAYSWAALAPMIRSELERAAERP